ncbi:hypothetical protein CPB85DRAFT_1297489 [Mucidula mucida]|nr:hypothetical protein CPB85DRAFT_1297489 [Mucidula mucida]
MTVRFVNWRLGFYVVVLLLSATVLGLSGHLANLFLPNLHKDFTTFALIIPSLTIFALMLTIQWSQPRIEVVVLFILSVLWLAMGAWSNDIIGHIQCDGLAGQRTATKTGDMSAQAYCYEMKVTEAFSWANFILFMLAFLTILSLTSQAQSFGRWDIWREPIQELGWFNEYPGFYNSTPGMMPMQYMPTAGGFVPYGQTQGQQQPLPQGHTLIVQPHHGQPPTITSVPYGSAGGV